MAQSISRPSPEHTKIAKYLRRVLVGEPSVHIRWDEAEAEKMALFEGSNPSDRPWWSFGTIGLSEHRNYNASNTQDVPVELVATSGDYRMANVMATLAFRKLKDGHNFWPDKIEENAVEISGWGLRCRHILLTDVFSSSVEPLEIGAEGRRVYWLEALPITEKERIFIVEHGAEEFRKSIPTGSDAYLNLDRRSFI